YNPLPVARKLRLSKSELEVGGGIIVNNGIANNVRTTVLSIQIRAVPIHIAPGERQLYVIGESGIVNEALEFQTQTSYAKFKGLRIKVVQVLGRKSGAILHAELKLQRIRAIGGYYPKPLLLLLEKLERRLRLTRGR